MSEESRFSAKIQGRVQGVGFRYFARECADELGIVGYARNTSDGAVEVVAEGNRGRLARFIGLLKEGPRSAVVSEVDVNWEAPTNTFDRFFVR